MRGVAQYHFLLIQIRHKGLARKTVPATLFNFELTQLAKANLNYRERKRIKT